MSKNAVVPKPEGIITVSTSMLVTILRSLLKSPDLVPCVFGPAGIGKSSIASQIADADFTNNMIDTRLGQLQEEDMTGIPTVEDGRTIYNLPFFYPNEGKGLWFMDEVNRAKKGMLQCLFQLILDRQYFNYTLPADWRMMFAGNWSPAEAIYQVEDLDPALRSRMCMLYYTGPTYSEWKTWALGKVADEVISFLGIHPGMLVTESKDEKPSPNPRTWEKASGVLKVTDDPMARKIALAGYLGLEPAIMLLDYITRQYEALPDPKDLKKGAELVGRWVNKKQNDRITAFLNTIVDYVKDSGGYDVRDVKAFIKKLPKEFSFSLIQSLYKTEEGKNLAEAVLGADNGLFDEELLETFEKAA